MGSWADSAGSSVADMQERVSVGHSRRADLQRGTLSGTPLQEAGGPTAIQQGGLHVLPRQNVPGPFRVAPDLV